MKEAWPEAMLFYLERKGTGDYIPHPTINQKIFSVFCDNDQKLLSYYFLESFQVEAIKHKLI